MPRLNRAILLLFALSMLGLASAPALALDRPLQVNVMTLNLHNGRNAAGADNIESLLRLVAEERPDLIALQEVEDSVLTRLKNSGYQIIHKGNANLGWFRFGNALLTKHPIARHRHYYLPSQLEQRGLLEVAVNFNGTIVRVFNTHLGLSHDDREHQLAAVTRILAAATGPFILMGDFNVEPHAKLFTELTALATEAGATLPLGESFPTGQPSGRPDQIWYSRHWQAVKGSTLPWNGSDHLPVLVTLALKISPDSAKISSLTEDPLTIEANLPDSPLLPDPTRLYFLATVAYQRPEGTEKIPASFTVPLCPQVSLELATDGHDPGVTLNFYKMLDLRDYASLIGVRGLGHWCLAIGAANNHKPWLEWGQYYRWSKCWGTQLTASTREDRANWQLRQVYLVSPRLSITAGANTDGAFSLAAAFLGSNSQVYTLGWQHDNAASIWQFGWSYRW